MRLLLGTHVFLWYISANPKLPLSFQVAIQDSTNEVYLSVVSVWEAVIKYDLDKLPLSEPPANYLPRQREAHGIKSLPIDESVMLGLCNALGRIACNTLQTESNRFKPTEEL